MYDVIMKSWGGTKYPVLQCVSYQEALDFCNSNDWVLCPEGGYVWDLEIIQLDAEI